MSFSSILLGMKTPYSSSTIQWQAASYTSSSLYATIVPNSYSGLSISVAQWITLASGYANLQPNCNLSTLAACLTADYSPSIGGFNIQPSNSGCTNVRIGLITNNENDCGTPDTFTGFGQYGIIYNYPSVGQSGTAAFGYVLVK